jgi:hypothetical protein
MNDITEPIKFLDFFWQPDYALDMRLKMHRLKESPTVFVAVVNGAVGPDDSSTSF